VPAALACNAIIGLDDYVQAECRGRVCSEGGLGEGGDDFRLDVPIDRDTSVPIDAPGANPVSWARWKMPHYPDAAVSPAEGNALAYTAVDGGLQDNVTNLVWMQPMPPGAVNLTWAQAREYCQNQKTAPNGPWRMPSRIELVTLLDLSQSTSPKFDPKFTAAQAAVHWTFSEVRPYDPNGAVRERWVVDFSSGRVQRQNENTPANVRCVKGGT
jgi:hypothetical protein